MFGVFDAHPMTLKGLRATGPPVLPAARLLTMGLQVLDGLLFLQANRIAHCDVKEDNVLVDECGCCYIADLGEAIVLVRPLLHFMLAALLARMFHARRCHTRSTARRHRYRTAPESNLRQSSPPRTGSNRGASPSVRRRMISPP
jgi:serine/threonine protein kinase